MAEQIPYESSSRKANILCAHLESGPDNCHNRYSYIPLKDAAKWIRLLTLDPAIDENMPLHASLWPVRRDEAPQFIPVSYTWGPEGTTSSLWVGDLDASEPSTAVSRCIPIRQNLEKLLRQFRSSQVATIIWVDALCINQEDAHEKGFQVRHMDEIYRDRQVWIWLGGRSENSDVAIDFVEEWMSLVKNDQQTSGSASKNLLKHADTDRKWSALWDLIGRPWFSRRWIVQECVLSNCKYFIVGERYICWEDLTSLVVEMDVLGLAYAPHGEGNTCIRSSLGSDRSAHDIFHELLPVPDRNTPVHELLPMPDRIESLIRLNDAYMTFRRGEQANLTLEKLVDDFCGFFSQDPRDGIYAFISMASDTKGPEWIPDYSQDNSHMQVYAQATRHIIRQTESLDIICRSNFGFSIPSWVPWFGPAVVNVDDGHTHTLHGYNKKSLTTFGQPLRAAINKLMLRVNVECDRCGTEILGIRHKCESCENFDFCDSCIKDASTSHADHTFRQILPRSSVYHASFGTAIPMLPESEWTKVSLGQRLTVRVYGWSVDTVSQVEPGIMMKRSKGIMTFTTRVDNKPKKDATESSELSDGFLRAITGNRRLTKVNHANPDHAIKLRISHAEDSWLQSVGDFMYSPSQSSRDVHKFHERSDLDDEIMASLVVMASGSRQYAKTDKSIGFVPHRTVPGDVIWVLGSCTVPVVLRKAPDGSEHQWLLIGECYIEGLMEGEFMEEVGRKSLKLTEINLV